MCVQQDICKNDIYLHVMAGKTPLQPGKIKILVTPHRPWAERVGIWIGAGRGYGAAPCNLVAAPGEAW